MLSIEKTKRAYHTKILLDAQLRECGKTREKASKYTLRPTVEF